MMIDNSDTLDLDWLKSPSSSMHYTKLVTMVNVTMLCNFVIGKNIPILLEVQSNNCLLYKFYISHYNREVPIAILNPVYERYFD